MVRLHGLITKLQATIYFFVMPSVNPVCPSVQSIAFTAFSYILHNGYLLLKTTFINFVAEKLFNRKTQSMSTEIQNIKHESGMEELYERIRSILTSARQRAYSAVNYAMVESYWLIGQTIVEHEQHGETRAGYGKGLLKELAAKLTKEYGKGLDERELRKMRQFYLVFKKRDTLRPELTWSHYRRLISIEDEHIRLWYMNEAANGQLHSHVRCPL